MKLSEIRKILETENILLSRSLGQNFLHDQNQLRRIVEAAELTAQDSVLEIGPGLGPLTELLLQHSGKVLAIEKDLRLVTFLRKHFAGANQLELIHADALKYLKTDADWSQWKLVSNLPYSVASPILVEIANASQPPLRMVVTLQLEVAQRLAANPGTERYGLLTLLVQLAFQPERSFKIPASCFFPEPDIDSACLVLVRRPAPLLSENLKPLFIKIVKRSFSQRRKMMFKLLKTDFPTHVLEEAFAQSNLGLHLRAEDLGLTKFIELTQYLASAKIGMIQNDHHG